MKRFEKLLAMALCIVMLRVCVLAAIADEATIELETLNVELPQEEPVQKDEIDEEVVVTEITEETVEVLPSGESRIEEPLPEVVPPPIQEEVSNTIDPTGMPVNEKTEETVFSEGNLWIVIAAAVIAVGAVVVLAASKKKKAN